MVHIKGSHFYRAFLIQVPLALLVLVIITFKLKLPKLQEGDFKTKFKRIDFAGAATLITAVFALLLGLDRGGNISWSDHITIACLATFGALFTLFLVVEWRFASEPFAPKHIVLNRTLLASYLCNFFLSGVNLIVIFNSSLYLQAVRGLNPAQVGLVLIPNMVGGAIGSVSSGLIMRATGRYYLLTIFAFTLSMTGVIIIAGVTGPWIFSIAGLDIGVYKGIITIVCLGLIFISVRICAHDPWRL